MRYELFYLVGESKEGDIEKIKSEIEKLVSEEGGKFFGEEFIEKRKLAYEIKKEIRGTYVARRFETLSKDEREEKGIEDVIGSITKKLNLYNKILRFIIVRADELPELKTKEEMSDTSKETKSKKTEKKEKKKDNKKEEPKEVKEKKVKEKEEKENKNEEDVDKKLDEILNI